MPHFNVDLTRPVQVVQYLVFSCKLTEIQAINLVSKHQAIVEDGIRMRSHVSYVGDEIASAEGLEMVDDEPTESGEE